MSLSIAGRAVAVLLSSLLFMLLVACGGETPSSARSSETLAQTLDDTAVEHALKHADPTYVCPMHPQIVRNEPGSCPICGMDLVLQKPRAAAGAGAPEVALDGRTTQNMGVRTTQVERGTLWKYIETVGYVGYDEDALAHVHARSAGWVEKLRVTAVGERVQRGQVLFEWYSPQLVLAQEEFLITLRGLRADDPASSRLVRAARDRLRLLSVPESAIDALERSRQVRRSLPFPSPHTGVVGAIGLREGMYVMPETELYTLADVSSVWVMVDVFQHQLDWVSVGRAAEMRVDALPGRSFDGEVDYVYPELDPVTRTLKLRLRFPNPDGALKPNMFADVVIYGGPRGEVLTLPREAVIPAPEGARVVKVLGEGRFQPVPVATGMSSGGRTEILSGLAEGDEVVISGQFLIDSESSLQASFLRMGPAAAEAADDSAHRH
ncbi:MAG: efflux RND transporter periplasmic adaptor subunit [Chromatiales bacterium]|nr:efflux RND transporter periplasmic adaptor subunit [Chromatiales bacterium]